MRSLPFFFVIQIFNKYAEVHSVTLWLTYGALIIIIRTCLKLKAYTSYLSHRKASSRQGLLMKPARILLKLVQQISKSLSLIVTGEHEVNVFENSRGPRVSHHRFTRFSWPKR
jgi:hypothetical protein